MREEVQPVQNQFDKLHDVPRFTLLALCCCLTCSFFASSTNRLVPIGPRFPARCRSVAYQGVPGAYSEMAALKACPGWEPLPCEQFETAFQALSQVRGAGAAAEMLRCAVVYLPSLLSATCVAV